MPSKFLIYGLVDPRDGQLRYVGKSTTGLRRPQGEFLRALAGYEGSGHRVNWFKNLQAAGLTYRIMTVQEFDSPEILNQAEVFWISYFRQIGCPLTNNTIGGDGFQGHHSAETKARMSAVQSGRVRGPWSEERRRQFSEIRRARKCKPLSDEQRTALALINGAQPFVDQNGVRYIGISQAARSLGLDHSAIAKVLRGKLQSTKGFTFKYVE